MFQRAVKMGQGVKRKRDEIDCEKAPVVQRQSILDISVGKLQMKNLKRVEPPLLRSVLILNTLKNIEAELRKEGMQSPTAGTNFTIPEVDPNSMIIDFLPEPEDHSKIDTSLSLPAPSLSEPMLPQSGPLPSIDTFVGTKPVLVSDLKLEAVMEKLPMSQVAEASLTTLYQTSFRMEEVLSDLDFSMCDADMFSSLSSSVKLTPLSAEEVLHSFPNSSSSSSSFDSYTNLVNVSPFCKSDIMLDDLDNIMQILVGS